MSAFKYLVFVAGVVLVAVYGAIINRFVSPLQGQMNAVSTTAESATGITWFFQFWDIVAIISMALLVFALIVAVVNRRRTVIQ